jgi:thiol-disulfide isomerase/thioredoxin
MGRGRVEERLLALSWQRENRESFARYASLSGGSVLFLAAALKFSTSIGREQTGFSNTVQWSIEGLLGIALLRGMYPRIARLCALSAFAIFACITFHEALMGLPSCGCFGAIKVKPWYTFGFDVLTVLGLAGTMPEGVVSRQLSVVSKDRWNARRIGWSIASLCGVALIGVGIHAVWAREQIQYVDGVELRVGSGETDAGKIIILEPSQWIGKRLPILSSVDVKDQIATGEWTVVLYHSDCPACRDAMPTFEQQARSGAKIAAVEMPPYAAADSELVPPSSACLRGRLSDKREWFATTPVVLTLRDGVVASAREGSDQVAVR